MNANKTLKCDACGRTCKLEATIYKIKHKGIIYCFCSEECKKAFQKKKFGEIVY